VAIGGSVTIAGHVRRDAVAIGGSVTLEPGARVEGDAVAIGGAVSVAEGATLGRRQRESRRDDPDDRRLDGPLGGWRASHVLDVQCCLAPDARRAAFVIALLIAVAFPAP